MRLLRLHQFVVHGFASAEEYLLAPSRADTSCLITDVRLPGLSGIDLQARLVEEGSRMPVIFVTAFPTPRLEERANAAGAAGIFAKPFETQKLLDCVRQAVASHRSSELAR